MSFYQIITDFAKFLVYRSQYFSVLNVNKSGICENQITVSIYSCLTKLHLNQILTFLT